MNLLALSLAALLSTAAPAGPDWLVTQDGARIETRGPWKVEGQRVVFQLPNGTLSAVRLSQIDLTASRALSETPADSQTDARVRQAESALKIGPKDVASAAPAPEPSENVVPESAARANLHISAWQDATDPADAGTRLRGTLLNNAETFAASLELQVSLYDERDQLLDSRSATIQQPSLDVGRSCEFEAFFPGQFSYQRVEFDLDSMPLRRGSPNAPDQDNNTDQNDSTDEDDSTAAAPESDPPSGGSR